MVPRSASISALIVAPLMLGIGIGIGAVGSANASTVSTTFSNAVRTAATSLQCAMSGACVTVTSTAGDGTAILGVAATGLGVRGTSQYSVGVAGESIASIGVNAKSVKGYAVNGVSINSDGVVGTSNSDAGVGVFGSNTSTASDAVGVTAQSMWGTALVASAGTGQGYNFSPAVIVNAASSFGGGINIESGNLYVREPSSGPAIATTDSTGSVSIMVGSGDAGLIAQNMLEETSGGYGPPGDGVFGSSTYGNGIVGSTASGPLANGGGSTNGPIPVAAVSANAKNGADLYLGYGTGTFEVTNDGNINASGTVTSGVTCAPTTCLNETKLTTYAPQDASPAVEDFGRAQMQNGVAAVRFDAAFAGTMNASRDYHVFITPEGENRGLYVAHRTSLGFTVGESLGGHSTLPFSYRIVASPYGPVAARLPAIRMQRYAAATFTHQQAILTTVTKKTANLRAQVSKLAIVRSTPKSDR